MEMNQEQGGRSLLSKFGSKGRAGTIDLTGKNRKLAQLQQNGLRKDSRRNLFINKMGSTDRINDTEGTTDERYELALKE